MLNIKEKENDSDRMEKIFDSPRNKSRITIEYQYNPITDLLGRGGYGEVYKVKLIKNRDKQKNYAIKCFNKINLSNEPEKSLRILNEIKLHRSINHEHICKYEHSFEDKNNVYILMEYCEKGNLATLLRSRMRLEEIEIRFYMFQVLLVLKYLRKQKIIHRDLTLGNIFLKDYKTVKIGDFGFAFRENDYDEKNGVICGTPGYYTPESNNCKYSYKTDIFDFGVCIYYLFGGKLPLQTSQESFDLFLEGELKFEKSLRYSEDALDLIKNTITIENQRLDLEKIYEHPFFKKGKGLSRETFPDYNDKDYMSKIHNLSKELEIKPMIKQIKKEKENEKNKKTNYNRKNTFNTMKNSSSSSYYINSNEDSFSDSNKKDLKNSKNLTFDNNSSNKNENNTDIENEKKSLENLEELKKKKLEEEEEKNKINNENIFNLGIDTFMERVNESNYKFYYYYYKNQKKLNSNNIIYITRIYDNLMEYCGIGYELNNKNIGFIFNDDSQMTKIYNNLQYIYYHKKNIIHKNYNHAIIKLPPKNISLDLVNKIKFFWQIIEEFKKNKKKKENYLINKNNINKIEEDIYIIKYKKRHKAYFFILSNTNIQVNFFDGVKIIFSFFPKGIIYFSNDKSNSISIFPLNFEDSFGDIGCEDSVINYKIRYALNEIQK